MEPSHQLFGHYLRVRSEENKAERPQNEWRQKPPRKKSRSIISAAIIASGKLFVTIGTRLQHVAWNEEYEDASEGPAYSYVQECCGVPSRHTSESIW